MLLYWLMNQEEQSRGAVQPADWDIRFTLVLAGLIVVAILLTLFMEWMIKK